MTLTMHPIESSNISGIGYEGTTLAVKFKNGGLYHYAGVTGEQFTKLRNAKSVGAHFHAHIKGKHKHTQIDEKK